MKRKWIVVVIALVILVLGAMGSSISQEQRTEWLENSFSEFEDQTVSEQEIQSGDPAKKVAVLDINGMIADTGETSPFEASPSYDHQGTLKALDQIESDDSVKAILLRVDSPGGTTYHSEELTKRLQEVKEARDIPIYVSMGTTAASGGYMVSMTGDKIFADNETLTGSIGVIMSSPNFSGFMEEHGLDMTVYKSGDNKDMGSPYKEPSEEEQEIFQSLIDESYNRFVTTVANGRSMSEDDVRDLADGRVYSGSQAKDNGLIDEIGYEDDALAALRSDNGLDGGQVVDMTPNNDDDYFTRLFSMFSMRQAEDKSAEMSVAEEMQMIEKQMNEPNTPQLYYMYGGE